MSSHPRINWYKLTGTLLILGGLLVAAYPFSPLILYELRNVFSKPVATETFTEEDYVGVDEEFTPGTLPYNEDIASDEAANAPQAGTTPISRVIIPKIGVDMELFEGNASALERGAWRLPQSRHPDLIGNTIITAHRYKYRPPSSKTFYLLDKMEIGDTFIVHWNGGEYKYRIDKKEVRPASDFTMLTDTFDRRVTLITCDPLFSTANRLIVSGRLVRN